MGTFPSHIARRDFGDGIENTIEAWNTGFQDSPRCVQRPVQAREQGVIVLHGIAEFFRDHAGQSLSFLDDDDDDGLLYIS